MDILNTYIELIYGFELKDEYTLNNITKVIGYMKDNGYWEEEILYHLIHNGPEIDDLFNSLTENTLYYNNELVIEPKAPIWHPEKQQESASYYREPRCRFSINDLLGLYYTKLNIPVELRDEKRDTGAFNHMLEKYKFNDFTSLDFIVTLIKLAEENEMTPSSPFSIEEYSREALDLLNRLVAQGVTRIVWRER